MSELIRPYPLEWPQGVQRTSGPKRIRSPFRTNYASAVGNVVKSLGGFQRDSGIRIDHPVLSSNIDLLGRVAGDDPGAAAWFQIEGQWVAFAVDRFPDPASNVQAIHHIIEARRTELRYGGLSIVRQTFKSFVALPAPAGLHWAEVLGVRRNATRDEIDGAYRQKARENHPDAGGSNEAMSRINAARQAAMAEVA